jgi:hypothetical protein
MRHPFPAFIRPDYQLPLLDIRRLNKAVCSHGELHGICQSYENMMSGLQTQTIAMAFVGEAPSTAADTAML